MTDSMILSSILLIGLEILGGLFQPTLFLQSPLILMDSSSFIEESNFLFSLIPIIVYSNAETDKSQILLDNKGKAGIYQWTHLKSGKIYIGSATDLSVRLKGYYNKNYLRRVKSNSYIYNAILEHDYSLFSLSILEFIDITNLSQEEARKLILSREQYYLDESFTKGDSTYNILNIVGSSLGYKHSEESLLKMSGTNNPMFGKTGERSPLFGKSHSSESLEKMRKPRSEKAKLNMSKPLSEAHKAKLSKAHKGKVHSSDTLAKISAARGTAIYIYDSNSFLVNTFTSATLAGKFFKCSKTTILRYANNDKLFKGQWILSFTAKE
jgi:group I intron endonuclease